MSNQELLDELESQGVTFVERLHSRDVSELGPNPTIEIGVHGALPQYILCGYLKINVDP